MIYYSMRSIWKRNLVDLGQRQGHAMQGQMFKNYYKINFSFLLNILFPPNIARYALFQVLYYADTWQSRKYKVDLDVEDLQDILGLFPWKPKQSQNILNGIYLGLNQHFCIF